MSSSKIDAQLLSNVAAISDSSAKYLPEPSVSGVGMFQDVMEAAIEVGSSALGGVSAGLGGDFADLLSLQIQAQKEMQATSMASNIEKSKHESKMAAIRNIRVN